MFSLLLLEAASAILPAKPEILVTASRTPVDKDETAASSVVVDNRTIRRLDEPFVASLLRLTPSAAVETSGPSGSFTEVRIRGAEANHTLLFIDGIRANDPASNDTPRFELLNADLASRVEIVRGPQSALWGSDAIGGVIAVNGVPAEAPTFGMAAEAGSFGFGRASASGALVSARANVSGAVGWQQAAGIDSFNGAGDKDGYRNLSGRIRASWALAPDWEVGLAAFSLAGRTEFDGFDPITFVHADTLDSSRDRLSAARAWISGGNAKAGVSGSASASLLGSTNRNFLQNEQINRTSGERATVEAQLQYRFSTGAIDHSAILAVGHDRETFRASDSIYGGATGQQRHRSHESITGEWRSQAGALVADVALRRDLFSAFADSTTLRASALVHLTRTWSVTAGYSEGIAQPTFFDLFGFFPGTFVGNPGLKPESSRGVEGSIRYSRGAFNAALTGYRQTLHDEIVDTFDPLTFLSSTENRSGASRRAGIEAEFGWSLGDLLRVSANYSYLDATQPGAVPSVQLREVRRPKHSGAIIVDGKSGRLTYAGSIAYVGSRRDTNFDIFPAEDIRLTPYWLAGARIAYQAGRGLELFVRGSNLLDAQYQDVFGYRTEGRAIYAGVKIGTR